MNNLCLGQHTLLLPRGRWLPSALTVVGLVLLLTLLPLNVLINTPPTSPKSGLDGLPLFFVPNAGQADPSMHFEVRDMGGTIVFATDETIFSLPSTAEGTPSALRMRFRGTPAPSTIVGRDRLPGTANYITGDDPALWRTDVPTYAGVIYRQLYPGIDLHYDGTSGQLKSSFIVAPGADPSSIQWSYEGAADVRVDESTGDLLVDLAGSVLVEQAPVAWQDIDGQRIPVAVHYRLHEDGSVGLTLGAYESTVPLTIDPTLIYGTYVGGSHPEIAEGLALDDAGNIYLTGVTFSSDLPTSHALDSTHGGGADAFVIKLNASGDTLLYATFLGGEGDDEGCGIAVDGDGNAYITGSTDSSSFPTTEDVLQPSRRGLEDAFVLKLNAEGNALLYSTYLGGSFIDNAEDIAIDSAGNAYVVGATLSSDFRVRHAEDGSHNGLWDAFVTRVKADGSALLYSTYLGGNGADFGSAIALDSDGNAYVVGVTSSDNWPTRNPLQSTLAGTTDLFVAKLSASENTLVYSTYLGGSGSDYGYGIAVDGEGHAYVTGNTESSDLPTRAPLQSAFGGKSDVLIAKLSTDGSSLVYSTYLGGREPDKGYGIAVDATGVAYVTGDTQSSDLPILDSLRPYAGNTDAFIAKVERDGSTLLYNTYFGGNQSDSGSGIVLDSAGNAVVVGTTCSSDLPIADPLWAAYQGSSDVFVVRIGQGPAPEPMMPTPTVVPPEPATPMPTAEPPEPATPTPTVVLPPITISDLAGSYMLVLEPVVNPNETFAYTIYLHNSGTRAAIADVIDMLPEGVSYVAHSASPTATYDQEARTLAWHAVQVPAGGTVSLAFRARAGMTDILSIVVNRARITLGQDSFERLIPVAIVAESTRHGWIPSVIHDWAR